MEPNGRAEGASEFWLPSAKKCDDSFPHLFRCKVPFSNRPVVTSLPLQTAETAAFSHFRKQKRVPSPVAWCCITRSSHMRLCLG